jgi:microcystin-dependent protein
MTVNNQGRITALSNASSAFLTGFIQMYSVIDNGSNVPSGWLWCNGSQYLQAAYPALYAAIGLTYSNPVFTPPGYFLVPSFMGRVPFGNSFTGTIGLSYTAGGVPTTTYQGGSLTIDINSLPNHTHGITWSSYTYAHNLSSHNYGSVGGTEPTVSTGQQSNLPTSTDGNPSQYNSYVQPFTTVNYIIKY